MSIAKPSGGSYGASTLPRPLRRLLAPLLAALHRRQGDRFRGFDVLYLHTRGAKTGQARMNPVARFEDGPGRWLIVASAGGAAQHPGWYHNIAAHPDEVQVEVGGGRRPVAVEQLVGSERDEAWQRVVAQTSMFERYRSATDREIPVLRLIETETVSD